MSENYHTPITPGAPANAEVFNATLAQMDQAITDIMTTEKDGHIIQEEGVDLPQQQRLNFIGANVTVTNNAGDSSTDVTIGDGGVTDHGALTGLSDDDHAQYLLKSGLREWDEQGSNPSTPAAGKWKLYFKADGLYMIDDAGVATGPFVPESNIPGVHYVTDYGAIGNGVTNDNAAIQSAIDTAVAGEVVILMPGTFLIDEITMKPGVAFIGYGQRASTFKANSNSQNLINYTAAATQSHFEIRNIGFDSNSKTNCKAIFLNGTDSAKRLSNVRISEILISGTFTRGIDIRFCANSFISEVFCISNAIGIYIDNCADTDVINCKVQSGSAEGYYINGGGGAFDEGVRLISCSTNGQVKGLTVNGQDWLIVSGCSFTTCSGGGVNMVNADNFKFINCDFAVGGTPAASGMNIDINCENWVVTGCHFVLNTFGISISGSIGVVSNNNFHADTNIDIYLNAASKIAIMGNNCDSTGSGFSIYEFTGSNYNSIIGNITNGTITVVGAQTVSANNVAY